MRPQDIKIGEHYRLRKNPTFCYVKPLMVIPANKGEGELKKPYVIVKCEHTINKNDLFGFIRYFRPRDIVVGK